MRVRANIFTLGAPLNIILEFGGYRQEMHAVTHLS